MKKYFLQVIIFLAILFSTKCFGQSGQWVWMKGDSTYGNSFASLDSFGTMGVFNDSALIPKLYGACGWSVGNNLYILGGCYYDLWDANLQGMNAMWEYKIDSNRWAWIQGDGGFGSYSYPYFGYYGTQGIPDSGNFPLFRINAAYWTDLEGNFWVFGGRRSNSGSEQLNDLWKYNISTGYWTWIKGPISAYAGGDDSYHYGVKGVSDSLNYPPGRWMSENWTDNAGNLWLFGGQHSYIYDELNDLWKYNIATNEWTWMSGDSVVSSFYHYGTPGVFDAANVPSCRYNNRLHWVDSLGNLYLFGGWTHWPVSAYKCDLWKYDLTLNQWAWIGGDSTGNSGGLTINECGDNNFRQ